MAYYKDVDAKRKKKEQQAVQWFGAKTQTPATTVLTKSDLTQNSGTKTGGALKNVFQGLKNAVVQSAELQSSNQNLIAQNTGATVKKAAQTTLGNLGQAASAYSQAQTTSANLNSALAKSAAKTTLGNLGQAASAYSQAQTTSANLNSVLAKSAGKTVTSNAAALSAAQANAQRATANATIQGAKDLSGQYGETWGMTTGVTGSDQTGASLWGYRNSENQTGRNAESEREKAERIREHIADGGADAVLYGIGARAMSGMKSLDGYNKLLQYSATGKIHDDPTVTPGTYSKIVDEAIVDYLKKNKGQFWADLYANGTEAFDDLASVATLGATVSPGLHWMRSSFNTVNDAIERGRESGASDRQIANYAAVNGLADFGGDVIERVLDKRDTKKRTFDLKRNAVQNGVDLLAQNLILKDYPYYERLVKQYRQTGYSKERAKIAAVLDILESRGADVMLESCFDYSLAPIENLLGR